MSDRIYLVSKGLAGFLTITGIALVGAAIGFGLSPPVMANYVNCGPFAESGCRVAAKRLNNFALLSFVGGGIVTSIGAFGLASLKAGMDS